jgi:hypothetical protein
MKQPLRLHLLPSSFDLQATIRAASLDAALIDLAIESAVKVPVAGGETIPELMERLGYTAIHDYSGIETFLLGTFEFEFVTHRRRRKAPAPVVIPAWKLSAQGQKFVSV